MSRGESDRLISGGLTLLEMLVVIAIMALLASAILYRLGGRGRLKLARAEQLIAAIDQEARTRSQRQGSNVSISLDVDSNTISLLAERHPHKTKVDATERLLPDGVDLERVLTARQDLRRGKLVVPYRSDATSDAYALLLRCGEETPRWIVVASSGQPTRWSEQQDSPGNERYATTKQIENFFRRLGRTNRADAR